MNFKQATPHFLDELYEVIVSRKGGDPKESYTAEIFEAGLSRSALKIFAYISVFLSSSS